MHKPLPMSRMKHGAICLPDDFYAPKPVREDSPAIDVMTDLKKVSAATVDASESIAQASQKMIARRVRLLLVVDAKNQIEGLITARDTMGEKPVKLLQERGGKHEELTVGDLMVPRNLIDVLDIDTVSRADVGSIIATLKNSGRQHALLVESDRVSGGQIVRGIFSATQIARQLGVAIPIFEVAHTFAEIAAALKK
nr:CBS domain-containing protein [Rhodoferax sp.]